MDAATGPQGGSISPTSKIFAPTFSSTYRFSPPISRSPRSILKVGQALPPCPSERSSDMRANLCPPSANSNPPSPKLASFLHPTPHPPPTGYSPPLPPRSLCVPVAVPLRFPQRLCVSAGNPNPLLN